MNEQQQMERHSNIFCSHRPQRECGQCYNRMALMDSRQEGDGSITMEYFCAMCNITRWDVYEINNLRCVTRWNKPLKM